MCNDIICGLFVGGDISLKLKGRSCKGKEFDLKCIPFLKIVNMKDFKRLIVWQKGFQLFISCHQICKKLPAEEKFELGSQLRRAAFSIPANISEGSAKATNAHKKIYLENALGSSYEVETAILALTELYPNFKQECEIQLAICIEVQKMLNALIIKLA